MYSSFMGIAQSLLGHLPFLDKHISLPCSNEVIRHVLLEHPWYGDIVWRGLICQLVPADSVKVSEQYGPNIGPYPAILVQCSAPQKVCTMWPRPRPCHGSLNERFREFLASIHLRAWFGEPGIVSKTRILQLDPCKRTQLMILRLHQLGILLIPECQYVQMFFSEVTGTLVLSSLRISSSVRESLTST